MSSLNKNINTVKCSTEGCNKRVYRKGLCGTHYVRPSELKTCNIEGCGNNVHRKGLCVTHYVSPAMLKTCATEGCTEIVGKRGAKGRCKIHYVSPSELETCSIEECGNNVYRKGLCGTHYVRPSELETCSIEGCGNNTWRKSLCGIHEWRMQHKGTTEPPELNNQTTHGYIVHDKTGTPVYIGITCNFGKRMYTHEAYQTWGPYVNIPEQPYVTFDNREQASEWEQQTIAKLTQTTPLFNREFNERWSFEHEQNLLERTIDIHNQHTMLQSVVESHA